VGVIRILFRESPVSVKREGEGRKTGANAVKKKMFKPDVVRKGNFRGMF